jgi:hypothetical protein
MVMGYAEEQHTRQVYLDTASQLWRNWGPAAAGHYFTKKVSEPQVYSTDSTIDKKTTTRKQCDSMMVASNSAASPAGVNQTAMVTHQQYSLAPSVIQQLPHQVLPLGFNPQCWPYGTPMLQQTAHTMQLPTLGTAVMPPTQRLSQEQSYSTTRHTHDDRGQMCTRSGKQYYYDSHRNTDDNRSTHTVTCGYRYRDHGRRRDHK